MKKISVALLRYKRPTKLENLSSQDATLLRTQPPKSSWKKVSILNRWSTTAVEGNKTIAAIWLKEIAVIDILSSEIDKIIKPELVVDQA